MLSNQTKGHRMYIPPVTTTLGEVVLHEHHEGGGHCGTLCFPEKGTNLMAKNVTKPVKEPTMIPELETVGIADQVNAKGTVVSDIMVERIEKHILYLNGTKGFATKQAQEEEQITFMETIGESLKLDFQSYVIVTDHLLKVIRANQSVFADGLAFRFMAGMDSKYPVEVTRKYKTYIEMLTKVASYWQVRFKLSKLIDLSFVFIDLDRKAKENITQYFSKLSQA